jgi:3-polyprenyl-4-hydroxybenzoate decarboxylase
MVSARLDGVSMLLPVSVLLSETIIDIKDRISMNTCGEKVFSERSELHERPLYRYWREDVTAFVKTVLKIIRGVR